MIFVPRSVFIQKKEEQINRNLPETENISFVLVLLHYFNCWDNVVLNRMMGK